MERLRQLRSLIGTHTHHQRNHRPIAPHCRKLPQRNTYQRSKTCYFGTPSSIPTRSLRLYYPLCQPSFQWQVRHQLGSPCQRRLLCQNHPNALQCRWLPCGSRTPSNRLSQPYHRVSAHPQHRLYPRPTLSFHRHQFL